MNTDFEVAEPVTEIPATPEAAYLQAREGGELFGAPLQPWSPSRVIAANSMGLVWPLPPEAADQLRANGLYAGALRDSLIVCWLRTLPNASEQEAASMKAGEWNVQRATRAPRDAFEAASEWGAAHGMIDLASAAFAAAYRIALATLLGVSVSEFEPVAPEGATQEESPPPNG